ncbi:MAG: transketolase [Candidatus Dormibacteria bacterium]|jgi:transketolase
MAATGRVEARVDLETLHDVAQQIRVDGIRASSKAGSGHPTSSMSAADLITVLAARHLRYDFAHPELSTNDHLIFSKGHASPLLYALYKAVGAITDTELMTYRTLGSRLEGHPTPAIPWVDVATGSLGQGLPIGVGVALAGKYLDHLPYRVWVLCGDSELAEGSCWEAFDKAAHYGLDNLTVIVDVNRLGQRGETEFGWNLEAYRRRVEAFGCRALVIDGHNLEEIDAAYVDAAETGGRPTVILARTIKGKGFSEIENLNGWHGKTLPPDMEARAIAELGGERDLTIRVRPPEGKAPAAPGSRVPSEVTLPTYALGDKVATRKAYGDALVAVGNRPEIVALDGEVGNSTYAEEFAAAHPDRFFEMFIAEMQMVSAAVGLQVRGYVPFASTFAAFTSRAYDFVRMAAISQANLRLCGSHAGCEIGADGPSQMALEDLAAMRAVQGSTVLYPSDAVSAAKLVAEMADRPGISYIRTTRGAYPVIYDNSEDFPIGGAKVLHRGEPGQAAPPVIYANGEEFPVGGATPARGDDGDRVAIVAAGVTVHHALAAAERLAAEGIRARVIDCYSLKPIAVEVLAEAARDCGNTLVVVEDHYPEGGLGGAVMEALAGGEHPPRILHLAVRDLPGSGTSAEVMAAAGIDTEAIVRAARHAAQTFQGGQ